MHVVADHRGGHRRLKWLRFVLTNYLWSRRRRCSGSNPSDFLPGFWPQRQAKSNTRGRSPNRAPPPDWYWSCRSRTTQFACFCYPHRRNRFSGTFFPCPHKKSDLVPAVAASAQMPFDTLPFAARYLLFNVGTKLLLVQAAPASSLIVALRPQFVHEMFKRVHFDWPPFCPAVSGPKAITRT